MSHRFEHSKRPGSGDAPLSSGVFCVMARFVAPARRPGRTAPLARQLLQTRLLEASFGTLAAPVPLSRAMRQPLGLCRGAATAPEKGMMDSLDIARLSLVTVDEILRKLDILLEDVIGSEVTFFGGASMPELTSTPGSEGSVVLGSACAVKVDHRVAAKMLSRKSVHRMAFETVFRKAVSTSVGVGPDSVSVKSIDDVDSVRSESGDSVVSKLMQGALEKHGGNPALAAAALATQTPSRVAQWIAGAARGVQETEATSGARSFESTRVLMVRFSVEVRTESASVVARDIQAMISAPVSGLLNDSFQTVFKKGTLGKLNDVLERCDSLLRGLEPKLEPAAGGARETLVRLNDVLERSALVLGRLEPELLSTREDVRGVAQRLNAVLDRSDSLMQRAERGLDAVAGRGQGALRSVDGLFTGLGSLLPYVKFALLGVGVCGFSVAYAICRLLVPVEAWGGIGTMHESGVAEVQ